MKKLAICLSLITIFSSVLAAEEKSEVYVAPDGNDSNPGTRELPLATLHGARDFVRELKTSGSGDITVWFRGGGSISWTKPWYLAWKIQVKKNPPSPMPPTREKSLCLAQVRR